MEDTCIYIDARLLSSFGHLKLFVLQGARYERAPIFHAHLVIQLLSNRACKNLSDYRQVDVVTRALQYFILICTVSEQIIEQLGLLKLE